MAFLAGLRRTEHRRVEQGADQGWTVITDLQLEGRGRRGRPWVAPSGTALLFSTILHPPVDVLPLLPLLVALSVAGASAASSSSPFSSAARTPSN